ncbi:class I SAM-dependent methyltransferase [Candidatus Leptofilum sp.]|uniref:class I SAM-dependent methyltransferase n=1 Tax=Candidatus Leptofilum sp. TaxID=3241576 RepID=UPI003B5BD9D3
MANNFTTAKYDNGFEETACEICGQSSRKVVAKRTDLLLGGQDIYFMCECQECESLYLTPRPTPSRMAEFYPDEYQPYTVGVHAESFLNRYVRRYGLKKRYKIIEKYVKQGDLLDVGCATGDFLAEVTLQSGWQVVGIETSVSAVRYAREQVGLNVLVSTLNQASFPKESFDVITMWDVLEHVYDPCVVLDEVGRLLRPGGIFVVNHPNLDSIDRYLFGRFWAGFELPRHLYLFPTKLLNDLMEQRNFRQVERNCLYGSHAGTSTSLRFYIQYVFGSGVLSKIFTRIALSKVARILSVPYFKVIDALKMGSNVTAVFQKQNLNL